MTIGDGPAGTFRVETTHKASGRVVTYALDFEPVPTESAFKPLGPFWVKADAYGVSARLERIEGLYTIHEFQECLKAATEDHNNIDKELRKEMRDAATIRDHKEA